MAEAPASEPVPSSSEAPETEPLVDKADEEGPSAKKRKVSPEKDLEKLEHRLGGILCCAVCLDLPQAAVYQCTNGHLMCAPCFTHLLADARLRDETPTCPNCRVEISRSSASRNLAVEKTVSELPSECKYCTGVFPRHSLQHHEEKTCEERRYKFTQIEVGAAPQRWPLDSLVRIVTCVFCLVLAALRRTYLVSELPAEPGRRRRYRRLTGCRYAVIGCPWTGLAHEAEAHEAGCAHPGKSAAEVVAALAERERRAAENTLVYNQIIDLLSYEKITFNDLQLKPYRTEEFVHKLYYETSRFSAFGHQWAVKAFVNKHQRDPTQSTQREITYQLEECDDFGEGFTPHTPPPVYGPEFKDGQHRQLNYQVILKSKPASGLSVQWVWVRGPWGEARLRAALAHHAFTEDSSEAPALPLPLADPADTNRLLASKAIHFRLIMFLTSK